MTHRKLLHTLTPADLEKYPCWIHSVIEDKEYATPVDKPEISGKDNDHYIVRTEFILKDHSSFLGFCFPQDHSGIDYIQPTIVTEQGHLPFYYESLVNTHLAQTTRTVTGKNTDELFPVKFMTHIKCDGSYYEGVIRSFVYDG